MLLKKPQTPTLHSKVTWIYLCLLFSSFPCFFFFNRLGLQPRICEPRDDQRPPAPTSKRCSDPHVWTSSNDPVCLHSQPGQTGLHQGHEVLLLKTTDNSVILCWREEKTFNGEQDKVAEMADAQCWEATFTLKILFFFFLNLWQVRHLSPTVTKTVLYVAQKQLYCGKVAMPTAQLCCILHLRGGQCSCSGQ